MSTASSSPREVGRGPAARLAKQMLFLLLTLPMAAALATSPSDIKWSTEMGPQVSGTRHQRNEQLELRSTNYCGKNAYLELIETHFVRVQTELAVNFTPVNVILETAVAAAKTVARLLAAKMATAATQAETFASANYVALRQLPALAKYNYLKVNGKLAEAVTICATQTRGRLISYPVESAAAVGAIKDLMTTMSITYLPLNVEPQNDTAILDRDSGQVVGFYPDDLAQEEKHKMVVFKRTAGTAGANPRVELTLIPDNQNHDFLCAQTQDQFMVSKAAYLDFQATAQATFKYLADLELFAGKLAQFFKGSMTESTTIDIWQLPVPSELLTVMNQIEELNEPLSYTDPSFDLQRALNNFNAAIESLATAFHFTRKGNLLVKLSEQNNSIAAFKGLMDDVIQIYPGHLGTHQVAVADLTATAVTAAVFRIWPMTDLTSNQIYTDTILVREGALTFTTNVYPQFAECIEDNFRGFSCSPLETSRTPAQSPVNEACARFILRARQYNNEEHTCTTAAPTEVAYSVRMSCQPNEKARDTLVVLSTAIFDFHCPTRGLLTVKLPVGQFEIPPNCDITSEGQPVHHTSGIYREMPVNGTLLAIIQDISKALLTSEVSSDLIYDLSVGVGVPVSAISVMAILIALFKKQCANLLIMRSCCKSNTEEDPVQIQYRYSATAPRSSMRDLHTFSPQYTPAPIYQPQRTHKQSYDAEELPITRLSLN